MLGTSYEYPSFVRRDGIRAEIDETGKYRYLLELPFCKVPKRNALIILKNPSVADFKMGDTTANRVANYFYQHDYDQVTLANLYAYRSTDSDELVKVGKLHGSKIITGPINDAAIIFAANEASIIVYAWGTAPSRFRHQYDQRVNHVKMLLDKKETWFVGRCSKNCYPLHGMIWGYEMTLSKCCKYKSL